MGFLDRDYYMMYTSINQRHAGADSLYLYLFVTSFCFHYSNPFITEEAAPTAVVVVA